MGLPPASQPANTLKCLPTGSAKGKAAAHWRTRTRLGARPRHCPPAYAQAEVGHRSAVRGGDGEPAADTAPNRGSRLSACHSEFDESRQRVWAYVSVKYGLLDLHLSSTGKGFQFDSLFIYKHPGSQEAICFHKEAAEAAANALLQPCSGRDCPGGQKSTAAMSSTTCWSETKRLIGSCLLGADVLTSHV